MDNPALQQLKDIHLPPAIHTWPLGPGWLGIYALTLASIIYICYRWYQRRQRMRTVKFALAQLKTLKALSLDNNADDTNIAAEISILIRRTALHYFRRDEIAGLSGTAWLNFLNQSGHTLQFTETHGQLLIDAPYRKHHQTDLSPLFTLAQNWLITISKKHGLVVEK